MPRNREVPRSCRADASGDGPAPKARSAAAGGHAAGRARTRPVNVRERVHRAAAHRGARRREGRAPVHQRGPDPQQRLQLVADVGRRRSSRRPASRRAATPRAAWRTSSLQAAKAALAHAGPRTRGDRCGAVLHLHQLPADAVGGDLAVRPAGHPADTLLVRPRRRVRRAALRAGRGHPAAAGGDRPVLVVCGEKFSDKIGTVRPSRMIFGDGAAAHRAGRRAGGSTA